MLNVNAIGSSIEVHKERGKSFWVVVVLLLIVISWTSLLDRQSTDYVDSAIVKAGVAYGAARGINALVSTVQSTTINFQFGGGIAVSIGEILDPVNDLVEQYSTLMKFAIGSLIIQKVLLEIIADVIFKIAIMASGAALVMSLLLKGNPYVKAISKTFLFLIYLRFVLVAVVLLNSAVSGAFIDEKASQNVQVILNIPSEFDEPGVVQELSEEERESLGDRAEGLHSRNVEIQAEMDELVGLIEGGQAAVDASESAVEVAGQSVSLLNRFLNQDSGLAEAREQLSRDERALAVLLDQQETLVDELEKNQFDERLIDNQLNGVNDSVLDALRARVDGLTNSVSPEAVRDRLESSLQNMLNVMSLFALETMILPLLFLYMFSKGMNLILGVDVRALLRDHSMNNSVAV